MRNVDERLRIGRRISALRKEAKMTQAELAERSGLQRSHIVRLERGQYGATVDVLSAIGDSLGLRLDFVPIPQKTFAVYPIVDGFSEESVFEGSEADCIGYKNCHDGEFIILEET